jgi:heme/copper-type cytochrome/quinol oxidase subunit 2
MTRFTDLAAVLNVTALWIGVLIATVVIAAMIRSILVHHRTARSQPAAHDRSATTELLWAVVPIVILVAAALPAVRNLVAPGLVPAGSTASIVREVGQLR